MSSVPGGCPAPADGLTVSIHHDEIQIKRHFSERSQFVDHAPEEPDVSEPTVLVARRGAVLDVRFNRPAALNALTASMLQRAAVAIEEDGRHDHVRVITIGGAGRAFSAGADLDEISPGRSAGSATIDAANGLVRAIRAVPKPVVATVRGLAAGVGCSVVLAADLAVARESSYLLLAFANIGLLPDGGATALLTAATGRARAARMGMLAERIDARTAEQWGLISHCVADDEYESEVERLVEQLAGGPTNAYAAMKRAFNRSALDGLESAFELERESQLALFGTDDFTEGVAAFRDKRPARFTGRPPLVPVSSSA